MRISPRKLLFVALTFGLFFVGGISQVNAYDSYTRTPTGTGDLVSPVSVFVTEPYDVPWELYCGTQGISNTGQALYGIVLEVGTEYVLLDSRVWESGWTTWTNTITSVPVGFAVKGIRYGCMTGFVNEDRGNGLGFQNYPVGYVNLENIEEGSGSVIFTVISPTPTTTPTTTIQFDYTAQFNYLVLLILSSWFILIIFVVKKQTLNFL